jgi:PAS domain S-box-containing protein
MTINATLDGDRKVAQNTGSKRQPLSLRNRLLIAFILLASLPVLLTGIVSGLINAQGSRTTAFNQMDAIAHLKASQINEWISSLHTSLDIILTDTATLDDAATVIENPGNGAVTTELRNKFNALNKTAGYFEELFITDANGQIVLSTSANQEGKIVKNQPYFHEGIKEGYVTPPFYDVALRKYSVVFSQPIQYQNRTIGVIAGRANLTVLNNIMIERDYLGGTGETYLIGANYALLSDLRFGQSKIGETYIRTQGTTEAIASQTNGTALYPNYRGISVLGAYYWVSELKVALIAETDESEALQASNRAFTTTVGLMVLSVVLAAIVAFMVTRTIVNPISQLVNISEKISAGNLEVNAEVQRADEIGALAVAFNTMTGRLRELIGTLESRVEERTQALATVAEIGTATATILDADKLMYAAVELTKERFNLYHSHIYLLDEAGENLVLASGAGEPGRVMVKEGRSIPLSREQSLVARAARERKGVTINDVRQAADFLPNPLLPNTRSELAVPMIVGNKVIGVFDIQSDAVGRFTDADVNIQTTLASQIAISIQNARQVQRSIALAAELAGFQSAVNEAAIIATTDVSGKILEVNQKLIEISKYSREELIGQDHRMLNSGYHPKEFIRDLWVTIANGKVWRNEIRNKAKDGTFYWVDTTIAPILDARGKPVQYVAIRFDITSRKELELLTAKRAAHVQALDTITQKIQGSTKIESALQIAARELGHALGMKQTTVSLNTEQTASKDKETSREQL